MSGLDQAQATNTVEEHLQQSGVEVLQIEMESYYPDTERVTNTTESHTTCSESPSFDIIDRRILPPVKTKQKKSTILFMAIVMN